MLERTVWDDARVDELKRYWATGDSAAIIGRAMRLSRNTVLGKAHRLGLGLRTTRVTGASIERTPPTGKPRVRIVRANGNSNAMRVVPAVVVQEMRLRCLEIVPRNISLLDLEEQDCRFIAGEDYLYCGHPKMAGSSYCTPHHHLVWEKPRAKKPKHFARAMA